MAHPDRRIRPPRKTPCRASPSLHSAGSGRCRAVLHSGRSEESCEGANASIPCARGQPRRHRASTPCRSSLRVVPDEQPTPRCCEELRGTACGLKTCPSESDSLPERTCGKELLAG